MTKKTIWITGASGKLGAALIKVLQKDMDNKIIGTDMDIDITDSQAVNHAVSMYRPTIIINCASISNADDCETNMVEAYKVNALGARNLATAARHVNAKIVQISTDDIFAGNAAGLITEFDIPNPNSIYGKSKLAGENYVKELNPKHLIIRSSWVYGLGKGDYFSYVEKNGKEGTAFEAPMDHISSPTSAKELAKFIVSLLDESEYGIYHASSEGACSRYEFAKAILEGLGYDSSLVKVSLSENSTGQVSTLLENLMMKMTGIYEMPNWQDSLNEYITSMKEAR